jgi:hypothetical protein
MRRTGIIALALLAVTAIGAAQAGAALASEPGAAEYELCVKRMPKKLRYEGQPANVRTGCHARLIIFSATDTWELEGAPGWSGSFGIYSQETFVFNGNNDPLCAIVGGKNASGGYGGLIDLNESTQPGKVDCFEQAETWYTKEVGS